MLSGKHPWDDGKQLPQYVSLVYTVHVDVYTVCVDVYTVHVDVCNVHTCGCIFYSTYGCIRIHYMWTHLTHFMSSILLLYCPF